ncbi:SGNH/GDSL hydrolase family protein [Mesobacillus jeotgali]|uniref:SGNH/GDSL hydrolase family protein n=1 Tax=Mesobacillus jeotgali TaxID=129985 RepID=UPI000C864E2E|nr:SGNH/GDSL hydrolase family protein [Mesobacillus jeotgali]
MRLLYLFGSMIIVPFLPFLYFQGKRVRASTPRLPEAEGTQGMVKLEGDQEFRVIFLGESSIAGVGVKHHEEGFAGVFAKEMAEKTNVTVHWEVYAKSGYTLKKIREKIVPVIPGSKVDLVVIGLGANDAFTLNNPWSWQKQSENLVMDLRSKFEDVPIVFANMPPIKDFPAFPFLIRVFIGNLVDILGNELLTTASKFNGVHYNDKKIRLSDWRKRMSLKPEDFFSDGVHPSKLTYGLWASELSSFTWEKLKLGDRGTVPVTWEK